MTVKTGSVIIKKVKKGGHAAAHGGAWKVAYADFVTAMMAFFLLLWLLSAVSQEQLEGISNYFAPQAASATTSGSGQVLGGQSIAEPGALGNPIKTPPLVAMDLPTPSAGQGSTDAAKPNDEAMDAETAEEVVKRKEEEQFEQAEETLRQAIQGIPSLKELSESLVVDDTAEGMRIQIVDQEGLAMFPRGTAEMYDHTQKMLALVAKVIEKMPQKIAIAGHTDSTKFRGEAGYSNWELSADRANASRRALIDMGVPEGRISRVVGKAAEEPLVKGDPANPRNRRITIVLMRGTGDGQAANLP
ncbi:flagellar motor protein MotB [Shumkonia mesophila]|uniref:flagellar motor protein MotB n=1 Tax=Shumkonia mesophila TaxID=2838854 RepID=UPI002934C3C7|nr:flagellar motor protein MotB [Shumkonia mesophila]